MHFWTGSLCYVKDQSKSFFPQRVVAISDIITLIADMGNHIPHNSWMLYLLELFNRQNIAIELNLICSFNDDGKFHAIFNGSNRYQFKDIVPIVNHSYLRQIIMNPRTQSIIYILKDQISNKSEKFTLLLDKEGFVFEGLNHFTGIEWWNKTGNFPYPIRYKVEISQLLYGLNDNPSDPESISYFPYNQLMPNKEGSTKEYPISFYNIETKDGCVCFKIDSGSCETGMKYSC